MDEGQHAFARLPEREHQLLLSIAQQPENRLTLAYTPAGTIVGLSLEQKCSIAWFCQDLRVTSYLADSIFYPINDKY